MCVRDVDVQCVLQFTLIHAAGCALHRRTSPVIHRLELSLSVSVANGRATIGRATRGTGVPRRAIATVRKLSPWQRDRIGNDPSAGSPTETLLRLLLPLNDQV